MVIILLQFPNYAVKCLNTIIHNGFEAYFVGGCVRDNLLNRTCNDIDIATSALPENIISMFKHTIPTGIKHGTVTVIIDEHPIEVTTYRQEFDYKDSRHPDSVVFVPEIEKDLSRRDFTINALACSTNGDTIDIFGGIHDLNSRIIRAVGNPAQRFEEDALRILRAFRFASVLDFEIEDNTKNAAIHLAKNINNISGERIYSELLKLAAGKKPSTLCELANIGALSNFGINSQKFNNTTIDQIASSKVFPSSKLAMLISLFEHNINLIKDTLKADNLLLSKIKLIDSLASIHPPENKKEVKLLLARYSIEDIRLYFNYLNIINLVCHKNLLQMLDSILENKEIFSLNNLAVNGNDLTDIGYNGMEIGKALNDALIAVINEEIENTKESILNFLQN